MAAGALVLIVNDYVLDMCRKTTGLDETGILALTGALVTTKAEQGSEILTKQGQEAIPAVPPLQVSDPTGAGDAYRAGLIKGLILKQPWVIAARMGAVLASYAVEQQGTQEHQLELADFWERYRANFGPPPVSV
jgi:adenosine kinase